MATYYFNAAVDNDWNNLNNWWMTFDGSTYSDQATSLPASSDDAIINANCTSNSGSEPTVNNLRVNGNTILGGFIIIITGVAELYDTSSTGGYSGTFIRGAIKFYDYSFNNYDCPGYDQNNNAVQIEFYDFSYNAYTICGDQANATKFYDFSYTTSTAYTYFSIFYDYAQNNGQTKGATFYNNSCNTGIVECSSGGEATFNDSSYNNGGTIGLFGGGGNCYFNNNSYNNGIIDCPTVTFKNSSVNKRGISGNIILDYPKGINGSSILGLV